MLDFHEYQWIMGVGLKALDVANLGLSYFLIIEHQHGYQPAMLPLFHSPPGTAAGTPISHGSRLEASGKTLMQNLVRCGSLNDKNSHASMSYIIVLLVSCRGPSLRVYSGKGVVVGRWYFSIWHAGYKTWLILKISGGAPPLFLILKGFPGA